MRCDNPLPSDQWSLYTGSKSLGPKIVVVNCNLQVVGLGKFHCIYIYWGEDSDSMCVVTYVATETGERHHPYPGVNVTDTGDCVSRRAGDNTKGVSCYCGYSPYLHTYN